ncbi:MAG: hypothetical protein M3Y40_09700, partial [Chloroflexota bacterium]|nr:hypothetical protein [Chloroflexota bacterium]
MNARVPGWPGLVGIVVLIGGLFAFLGRPATSPLGGVTAGSGGYLQTFMYAALDGPPDEPLDLAGAGRTYAEVDAAIAGHGEDAYAERRRHVVALFDTAAEAETARETVEGPPNHQAFVLDRLLFIIGLPTDEDGGPTPIADELRADAALVLVEGDRYGEGTIALDLTCTAPDDAAAIEIATALGDYGAFPYYAHLRPPWVGEPLTDDEALARSTYRRWASAMQTAFGTDPWIASWSQRYVAARTTEERGSLQAELAQH